MDINQNSGSGKKHYGSPTLAERELEVGNERRTERGGGGV
jgi:hypothetical protein